MKISIRVPKGKEEAYNKLPQEEKAKLKQELSDKLAEALK